MNRALERAFTPARLGQLALRNRVIKSATFEGMTPDGVPGEQLLAFHKRIAEGGTAMTTIAYCAAEPDGRVSDQMTYMGEPHRAALERIVAELKTTGAAVSGQLSHCGGFSKNRKLVRLKRPLGPSRQLNMLGLPHGMPLSGAMSHQDMDALVRVFHDAAGFMKAVGFDAIELHFGHGYGLSQFISPRTNRRSDEYGGSLANRMRLPRRVMEAVRDAVGDGFPVLGKMSMCDGVSGGIGWDEGVEVAAHLDAMGVDAIITSGGTSSFNPMLMFRGDSLIHGLIEAETNPIARLGMRLVGPKLFREYPYQELYFLDGARRVRDRVKCPVVYIGGCSTMESLETLMADGFEFVQLGRALIKDPDFVRRAMGDRHYVNGCIHCNRCAGMIEAPGGIRCPLNDPAALAAA